MHNLKGISFTEHCKQLISTVILLFGILAFIPIIWISFYNHPSADDFNFSEIYTQTTVANGGSIIDITKSAIATSKYFYDTWQGTYTASFLNSIHPGIFGTHEEYYALTTYIICISIFVAILFFMREIFLACGQDIKFIIPISLAVMLTIIEGFPSPVQGLFWYTGAMSYMFFLALSLLQAALLLSYKRSSKHLLFRGLLGVLNAFLIAGGNHITAFLIILISLGFLCFSLLVHKMQAALCYISCSLTSILGFIFVMTAPGTAVRAGTLERASIPKTIIVSIFNTFADLGNTINLPLILLLCLLTIFLSGNSISTPPKFFKFRYSLLMLILSFGLYCASFCVPYYAMGFSGTGRISNMRYSLFVLLVVLNFFYLYHCIYVWIISSANINTAFFRLLLSIRQTLSKKILTIFLLIFSSLSMTFIVFFSYRTSVTTNCIIDIVNGEAAAFHHEKLKYIGTDFPQTPAHMPKMIFYSTSMQDS